MGSKSENGTKRGPGRIGRAGPVSRQRIVEAGLKIVRSDGLEALTMKRLASTLGCGLMTLYYHVSNRDDLLTALLDDLASNVRHPPAEDNPVDELAAVFITLYRTFRDDPWAVHCLINGHMGSVHALPLAERALLALEALGFQGAAAGHSYYSLIHYTYGEVLVMDNLDRQAPQNVPVDPELERAFPAFARTLAITSASDFPEEPYERSLRRLLRSMAG